MNGIHINSPDAIPANKKATKTIWKVLSLKGSRNSGVVCFQIILKIPSSLVLIDGVVSSIIIFFTG